MEEAKNEDKAIEAEIERLIQGQIKKHQHAHVSSSSLSSSSPSSASILPGPVAKAKLKPESEFVDHKIAHKKRKRKGESDAAAQAPPESWEEARTIYESAHNVFYFKCTDADSKQAAFVGSQQKQQQERAVDPVIWDSLLDSKARLGHLKNQDLGHAHGHGRGRNAVPDTRVWRDHPFVRPAAEFEKLVQQALPKVRFVCRSAFKLLDIEAQTQGQLFGHLISAHIAAGVRPYERVLTCVDLCGGPGSFVEALILLTKGRNVQIRGLTLNGPLRYRPRDWSVESTCMFHAVHGDITDSWVTEPFVRSLQRHNVQWVTADGGIDVSDKGFDQEVTTSLLIVSQALVACSCLSAGGMFLLKLFDTTLSFTLSILEQVRSLFQNLGMCRPMATRPASPEKYIVFMGFKDPASKDTNLVCTRLARCRNLIFQRMAIRSHVVPNQEDLDVCMTQVPELHIVSPAWREFWYKVNGVVAQEQVTALRRLLWVTTASPAVVGSLQGCPWSDTWVQSRVRHVAEMWTSHQVLLHALFPPISRSLLPIHNPDEVMTAANDQWLVEESNSMPTLTQYLHTQEHGVCLIPPGAILVTFYMSDPHMVALRLHSQSKWTDYSTVASEPPGSWTKSVLSWLQRTQLTGVRMDLAIDPYGHRLHIVDAWSLPWQGPLESLNAEVRRTAVLRYLELICSRFSDSNQDWSMHLAPWTQCPWPDSGPWLTGLGACGMNTDEELRILLPRLLFWPLQRNLADEKKRIEQEAARSGRRKFQYQNWMLRPLCTLCPCPCCVKCVPSDQDLI